MVMIRNGKTPFSKQTINKANLWMLCERKNPLSKQTINKTYVMIHDKKKPPSYNRIKAEKIYGHDSQRKNCLFNKGMIYDENMQPLQSRP